MGTPFNINLPISANTLIRIRFIQERLLPLIPIFHSYEETFARLSKLNDDLLKQNSISLKSNTKTECTLQNMARQIAAYKNNVDFLLQKINTMAQLLSDILALKNQQIAQDQNNQLTKMTQITVQNSATLRAIGVATLVFLPIAFVAVGDVPHFNAAESQCDHFTDLRSIGTVRNSTFLPNAFTLVRSIAPDMDHVRNFGVFHYLNNDMVVDSVKTTSN